MRCPVAEEYMTEAHSPGLSASELRARRRALRVQLEASGEVIAALRNERGWLRRFSERLLAAARVVPDPEASEVSQEMSEHWDLATLRREQDALEYLFADLDRRIRGLRTLMSDSANVEAARYRLGVALLEIRWAFRGDDAQPIDAADFADRVLAAREKGRYAIQFLVIGGPDASVEHADLLEALEYLDPDARAKMDALCQHFSKELKALLADVAEAVSPPRPSATKRRTPPKRTAPRKERSGPGKPTDEG